MAPSTDDFETVVPEARKVQSTGPSLKARAIAILSRREHSRRELQRKLAPHCDDVHILESLLDELAHGNWQSDERFAQSLVHRRAGRHGWQRIQGELRQHGIDQGIIDALAPELVDSETCRARDVWQKKFGLPPDDRRAYARQYRFMTSRGFSPAAVRAILGDVPF